MQILFSIAFYEIFVLIVQMSDFDMTFGDDGNAW